MVLNASFGVIIFTIIVIVEPTLVISQLCSLPSPDNQDLYACSNLDCFDNDCSFHCEADNKNDSPISMRIINEDLGKLEVKFKLHNLKLNRYLMELYVDETASPEECSLYTASTSHYAFKLHSAKSVYFNWCDNKDCLEDCKDTITLEFNYIYTACYRLTVWRFNQSNMIAPTVSCGEMMKTRYMKKHFADMEPTVAPQYHTDSATLLVKMEGYPEVIWIRLSLSSESKKSHQHGLCEKCLTSRSCCVYDRINNFNETFQCEDADSNSTTSDCLLTHTDEFGREEVHCTFNSLQPGNYCISIIYGDDRCQQGSTWGENHTCHWTTSVDAYSVSVADMAIAPPGDHITSGNYSVYVAIVSAFCFVFLLLMSTMFALCYWQKRYFKTPIIRRVSGWPPRIAENIGLFKLGNRKVFLLYPRDCVTFMEAMARFRQVLKRANCEVFDYWDPDQYNIVATCPNAFVQLMTEKSVQVVVGASDCSRLLERSVLGNANASYKFPHCFDNLFLYGLQCLHQTTLTDCYEKIYVVSLGAKQNSSEVHGLAYLNPLTVFTLPTHLEKLIFALHGIDGSDYATSMKLPEVVEFNESVDQYSRYRETNPSYLDSMLDVHLIESVVNIGS